MSRAARRRKGFFLVETVIACFIAAMFLSASLSALFISSAVVGKLDGMIKRERDKREELAQSASYDEPARRAAASEALGEQ